MDTVGGEPPFTGITESTTFDTVRDGVAFPPMAVANAGGIVSVGTRRGDDGADGSMGGSVGAKEGLLVSNVATW